MEAIRNKYTAQLSAKVTTQFHEKVKKLAKEEGIAISDLVRQAVIEKIDKIQRRPF